MTKTEIPVSELTTVEKFAIANNMLMLQTASLQNLVQLTHLPEAAVLEEIKELRRDFGLKGNKRIGYTLSPEAEDRVGMCSAVQEMEAQWSAVHEMTEAQPEHI